MTMTTMSTRSILAAAARIAFLAVANTLRLVNADPDHPDSMQVIFVNESPSEVINLYWEDHVHEDDHPDRRRFEAHLPPRGGWHRSETYQGHEFSYEFNGKRHYVNPPPGNFHGEQYIILAGDSEGYRVRCDITVQSQKSADSLDILVKPYWAPRGAARFLELVRSRYYDGAAFHSVVPGGVAQFGIAADFATREKEQELRIWDDFPKGLAFEPGMLSFAGTGFDSRRTEVFIVMPGASQEQTAKLGENSWETPFAQIYGDVNTSALKEIYSGYGEKKGPDPSKMYEEEGYTDYLPKKFPKLDYINKCYIVDEIGDGLSDGEL